MTDEKKDPPIEPQEFRGGVTVIDIGDLRIARGRSRRPFSSCQHLKLVYDDQERRIWCRDCERDLEPFDAFHLLAGRYSAAWRGLQDRARQLTEIEGFKARTLAAKTLDQEWRRKHSVPACPHCRQGLFPQDFPHSYT